DKFVGDEKAKIGGGDARPRAEWRAICFPALPAMAMRGSHQGAVNLEAHPAAPHSRAPLVQLMARVVAFETEHFGQERSSFPRVSEGSRSSGYRSVNLHRAARESCAYWDDGSVMKILSFSSSLPLLDPMVMRSRRHRSRPPYEYCRLHRCPARHRRKGA